MIRKCFLIFLLTTPSSFNFLIAQTFPSDLWHEGKLIRNKDDTLTGFIKYRLIDSVYVKKDKQVQGFSSRDILSFQIKDQSCKCIRQFYSLPYAEVGQYKSPAFFEVITTGEITLLGKEQIENHPFSTGHIAYSPRPRWLLVTKYFVLKDDGSIEGLYIKKKVLQALMGIHSRSVFTFARKRKLDINQKYQLKVIIDYYNSFFSPK